MPASADKTVSPLEGNSPALRQAPIPGSLRTVFLPGPAGRLEALVNEGRADAPFAALICHPHPLGGGSMHNKVVFHTMKVLTGLGWPVLRFNFRGTGLSEGEHDGRGEVDDVRAGLAWLRAEYGKPVVAAGFSFGAAMGLEACCADAEMRGFAALGLPTHAEGRDYRYPFLSRCAFPKLFLSGDRDQFAPSGELRLAIAEAAEPKRLVLVPGADHFFTGHLTTMQAALSAWLGETFPAA